MGIAAILAGIDAREWAGVELFTRTSPVNAPAAASLHDSGHYPDLMALLTGWGCYRTLNTTLQAQWSGVGTITCGIGTDGLFYLQNVGGAAYTVTPGASDPWGWGGVVASSGGIARATRPWTRGVFDAGLAAQFTIAQLLITETVPLVPTIVHALPTWLSGPTTPDADEVTACVEKWDNDAHDATEKRFRWGIDADGRVFSTWPTSFATHTPTFSSASFRRALGFTGSEVATSAGSIYTFTATYPGLGVLIARNGLQVVDFARENAGSAFDLMSGEVAGRSHATWREVEARCELTGGVGLAESDSTYLDEEQQLMHRVSPYLFPGARATLLPEWGDPRRGKSRIHQLHDGDLVVAQSAQVRSDVGGALGRRRCQVATSADRRISGAFAQGGPRTRIAASWRLRLLDG